MLTKLVHDACYGASIVLNVLLITLIATETPPYLKSYSLVLLYLAIVQMTTAFSSLVVFKKVLSTPSFFIDEVDGIFRHWLSPSLCLVFDAIQMAGTSHHAVIIAFCSGYRYCVLSFIHCEQKRTSVLLALLCAHIPTIVVYINFALTPLLEGADFERALNESHPEYGYQILQKEMLLVLPYNWPTVLGCFWVQALIVPVCIVVILCSLRIHGILASVEHMSANNRRRHKEIHRMASIFTVLSPPLTMAFTPPYREALKSSSCNGTRAAHSSSDSENLNAVKYPSL